MEHKALIEKATVYLGQPIDPNLKVPVALAEIADVTVVDPGVTVKTFADDANGDGIYTVDANGIITVHKVTAAAATALTFGHWNSYLEYILVSDIMDAEDQGFLARKKASITRAMDKLEVKNIITACVALSGQSVTQATGEDVYDVIMKLKQKIEDYGDNYILLVSSSVQALIDDFDKTHISTFNYSPKIQDMLRDQKIQVVKITGALKVDGGATSDPLIAAGKAVLVARDSTLAAGKPIQFVRRRISKEIAEGMGVSPDAAERAIVVCPTPTVVSGASLNTLAYGTYGYESIILAITNTRAISYCAAIS